VATRPTTLPTSAIPSMASSLLKSDIKSTPDRVRLIASLRD
jgi:hypothetical protein